MPIFRSSGSCQVESGVQTLGLGLVAGTAALPLVAWQKRAMAPQWLTNARIPFLAPDST